MDVDPHGTTGDSAIRLVGRYMVHRRIAAGGMATVHLGRLLGAAGFSRMVAIKRLHDGYARDPEFVAMLLDEARLASQIRHPNVVATLDVVAEQDELLVVMEYVEGDSLAHLAKLVHLRGERFPIPLAASIVAHALHGLHAAHEARDKHGVPLGIVHRDVSPQNVLVGIDGVARVLDFGIAKAASRSTATEDGQIKGKTAYMAPEQLMHASVDRRTDIWAAAVMLWELLTGRRLFLSDSPAATIARVLHDAIDNPQRYAADIPPELGAITLRGLERDPAGRFASAEEMAFAIEDALTLPRSKDVGAWVANIAAANLESRAELVREVERTSAPPMPAHTTTDPALRAAMEEAERRRNLSDLPTDMGAGNAQVAAQIAAMTNTSRARMLARPSAISSRPGAHFAEVTDLATVRSSANYVLVPEQRVSRLSIVLGILVGMAMALAVVLVFVFTRNRSAQAKMPEPAPPVSIAMPSVEPATPPVPVIELPPAPVVTAPSAAASAKKHTAVVTRPGAATAKPPDCRMQYTVDEKGNKHFKPECI